MIVKNESATITRALASVLPLIDYWIIVDTGSTDGTQQIIKDFMKAKGVPGELHERSWVNFSYNRNEALQLACSKGDYLFFIDADEYLVYDPDFKLPLLDKDYYYLPLHYAGVRYHRISLISNHVDWKWEGALHEGIYPPAGRSEAILEKVSSIITQEGARAKDPLKYQKDAEILETETKKEPNNSRHVFHLAQTYANCGKCILALQNYEKRTEMGGEEQEVFWALLQIARLQEILCASSEHVIDAYKRAQQYRPSRIEPLYYLALYCRKQGAYDAGYDLMKKALSIPPSGDISYVEEWLYTYGIILEFSMNAYWTHRYDECQSALVYLLKMVELPSDIRECVEKNLGDTNIKLLELVGSKK
ncbi:MAG: hypothetical protein JWO53_1011 [Chlamydiia bacterium]|nr:hypothetical protein [Chlamydiia bacterium]